MKNFARFSCFSAQTGKSASAGNNPDRAAAVSSRAAESESENLCGPGHRPGPHLEDVTHSMFDCDRPGRSGGLAGESFAATLENHKRYPTLRSGRHAALFGLLDDIVANHIDSLAEILRGLGFDEVGTAIYRSAALTAFRASRPST